MSEPPEREKTPLDVGSDSSSELSDPPSSDLSDPPSSREHFIAMVKNIISNGKPPKNMMGTKAGKVKTSLSSGGPPLSKKALQRRPIYPTVDRECKGRKNHQLGEFCTTCKAIPMPWGAQLPYVEGVKVGAEGSMVADVPLRGSGMSVAIISVIVFLRANNRPIESIENLSPFIGQYIHAVKAGEKISELFEAFAELAENGAGSEVPKWHTVVNTVLEHPNLSFAGHIKRAMGGSKLARPLPQRPASYVTQTTQANMGRSPVAYRLPPPYDIVKAANKGFDLMIAAAAVGKPAKGEESADEKDEEMAFEPLETPEGNAARHGPKGKWVIYEGQDTSVAKVDKVDPSKFFLVRQSKDDPTRLDLRQYSKWKTFNWNEPADISALNRARDQWIRRTTGTVTQVRYHWTEAEKGVLKSLVERELSLHPEIDWEVIATNMNKHFEQITQKKGDALARTSCFNVDGEIRYDRKTAGSLSEDRVGSVDRTKTCCSVQAYRYVDIKQLIAEAGRQNKRTRNGKMKNKAAPENDLDDADEEEEGAAPKKKAKRITPSGSSRGNKKKTTA